MSKDHRIKILYVAGFERSGSTIINRVLGQLDGFVAWGELRDIWEHGKIENRTCTCGDSFSNCEAWTQILDKKFDQALGMTAHDMLRLKKQTRAAVLLKSLGSLGDLILKNTSAEYLNGLAQLYDAIQTKTNSQVIVDSTKAAWYGYALSMLENIELYVVHIVRDPRGVCYSLHQRKSKGEPECQWYNPLHASISWNLKNLAVESLLKTFPERYTRIKYEDFVSTPKTSVIKILKLLNEPHQELPFIDESTIKMKVDHIISGSPSSRSEIGEVKLQLNEKWRDSMLTRDQKIIESISKI